MASSRDFISLHVIEGPSKGQIIEVKSNSVSVGRLKRNKIFLDDQKVSNYHANFSWKNHRWVLSDKADSLGTFVNEIKIQSGNEIELSSGDLIKFGENSIVKIEIIKQVNSKTEKVKQLKNIEGSSNEFNNPNESNEHNCFHNTVYSKSSLLVFYVIEGPCKDDYFDLILDKISIGRGKGNAFRFKDDAVSEKHAIIELKGDAWYVTDLKSTNGTFLNNNKIDPGKPVQITNNDQILFGESSKIKINFIQIEPYENLSIEDFMIKKKDIAIENLNAEFDQVVNNLNTEFELLKKKLYSQYGFS